MFRNLDEGKELLAVRQAPDRTHQRTCKIKSYFSDPRFHGIRRLVVHIKTDHTVRARPRMVHSSGSASEGYEAHTLFEGEGESERKRERARERDRQSERRQHNPPACLHPHF